MKRQTASNNKFLAHHKSVWNKNIYSKLVKLYNEDQAKALEYINSRSKRVYTL